MVKINKRTYRERKLKWFEGMLEMRKKEFRRRKIEHEDYKIKAGLEMKLMRMRLIREQMLYAVDNIKADQKREEEKQEEPT